ncbi:hypothetical protein [Zymobacter palmae]|uniref:hypothetical protein n=1 Tax=Zymobacter palmae TaxID=33074 RepID=UPI0011AEAB3A|nr:hypothetical protein [Zymobacter palmae]
MRLSKATGGTQHDNQPAAYDHDFLEHSHFLRHDRRLLHSRSFMGTSITATGPSCLCRMTGTTVEVHFVYTQKGHPNGMTLPLLGIERLA